MQEQTKTTGTGGDDGENLDLMQARYGSRFLRQEAPCEKLPSTGMPAVDAMRLVGEELMIDGLPMRNLATFVTTWMEPFQGTIATTDGERMWAFLYSSERKSRSLSTRPTSRRCGPCIRSRRCCMGSPMMRGWSSQNHSGIFRVPGTRCPSRPSARSGSSRHQRWCPLMPD